jgi:phage gpG-like protein
MAGVSGDFTGLARLIGQVSAVTTPEWQAQLLQGMGVAALKQLMDQFRDSRDPYGKPWAPLVLRKGKPLLDTGRMRASATLVPLPHGFEIVIGASYAATHQYGKRGIKPVRAKALSWKVRGSSKRFFAQSVDIPQRMMIPPGENPGPYWMKAISDEAELRVKALFSGRGP